jgi:hypothetical protein
MSATTNANGLALLKAVNFDRYICGALIATRENDWQELLDSIPPGPSRRNVAVVVFGIREALGLKAGYARDIYQGTE